MVPICVIVSLMNVLILHRQYPWWSEGPDKDRLSAAPGLQSSDTAASPQGPFGSQPEPDCANKRHAQQDLLPVLPQN